MTRSRIRLAVAAALVAAGLVACSSTPAVNQRNQVLRATEVLSDQDFAVPVDGGLTTLLPVYASAKLVETQAGIKRAVIAIQTPARDAVGVFDAFKTAMGAAVAQGGDAILLVPQFLTQQDIDRHQLGPEFARWTVDNWQVGGGTRPVSLRDAGVPVSSFAVLDALLLYLADRQQYPDLEEIQLVGFGASARLIQLHAAVGKGVAAPRAANIRVRYVALSPESHLYFDDRRAPRADAPFAPVERERCAGYQLWPYGTVLAPSYAASQLPRDMAAQYAASDMLLLRAEREIDGTDRGCEALVQGRTRVERLDNHLRHLAANIGGAPANVRSGIARGADGSLRGMLGSACVREVLSGAAGC
jgi:hypothetical protein